MPTAQELIKTSAIKLGAIGVGENLTADEATDSLNTLNSMLDSLSIDKKYVYHIVQDSYTWPSAASSRTIGSGGDFDTTRPERIEAGSHFRDANTNDYPVLVTNNRIVYDRITVKNITSTYPHVLFYDKAFPLGVLYVYPVPNGTLTLKLNSWQILQNFSGLTTSLSLPKGYQWMIEHNLAVALEGVFQLTAPESVHREAERSLARLARLNSTIPYALTDAYLSVGGKHRYDIDADD